MSHEYCVLVAAIGSIAAGGIAGLYAGFHWGWETATKDDLEMIESGAITINHEIMQREMNKLKAKMDARSAKESKQ